jgi:acyl dehydratase
MPTETESPPRGRWFEDLQIGSTFVTKARTITEADVVNFCGVSGDFNGLHTDAELMKASPFGARIAHGTLVLSIVTGLRVQAGYFEGTLLAFAEIRRWRFRSPVFIGDTVRARNEVIEVTETSRPDRGIVVQRVDVLNARDEIVQGGEVVSMVRRRGAR